ncbi:hypothetical protein [Flavobacterium sp. NRK F7]|uniref:hypothetical protein n=1 Tax=Flavobacterium sp. NRK F7 TaxID=2954930 RepID=UPI0020905F5D|nr:hypothetical protein [Flavobacterium sp. NRK F7]MCO6162562.1 hypothetical protein [Flavobacterium sp. NRK F7]
MKYKLIISTIIYLIIISLLINQSYFNNNAIKDVALITSSFVTLVIALLLYDRYNYRKLIFEKKLDIVLQLLLTLKNTRIQISYRNFEKESRFLGNISVDRIEINRFLNNQYFNIQSKVIFEALEIQNYLDEIMRFKTNPFMPKEIVERLEFLSIIYFEGVENKLDYQNEYVKLSINKNAKNFKDLKDWYKPAKDISFAEFISNYLKVLIEIEKWINKHSNTESKLNL